MTSVDPELAKYLEELYSYEDEAFKAAEAGEYDTAIEKWSYLLDDDERAGCFSPEAQQEMAFNLAAAYYVNGDDESFERIASEWSLSDEDRTTIRESVEIEVG